MSSDDGSSHYGYTQNLPLILIAVVTIKHYRSRGTRTSRLNLSASAYIVAAKAPIKGINMLKLANL
jgi:hypothetical protein